MTDSPRPELLSDGDNLPIANNKHSFDDGALALYDDHTGPGGVEYFAPDGSIYGIDVVPPSPNDPGDQYRVELQRSSSGPNDELRVQSLTMAEYPSEMAAEEHAREIGQTLFNKGLGGLVHDVNRLNLLPDAPPQSFYMMGLYPPPSPSSDEVTLNLLRMGSDRVELVPIAHGSVDEVAEIEQRLFAIQMEGDTNEFLKAAAVEAVQAKTLAPGAPLFDASVGDVNPAHSWLEQLSQTDEWPDHPDWPDRSVWDEAAPPRPAAMVLPVTFDDDRIPFDEKGHYVPHHVDEEQTTHFFSVIPRPADSPLSDEHSHELRYYRAQIDQDGLITHHSQPVMPVDDSTTIPWPLPALQMHLEEGEVDVAQVFSRDIARDLHGLDFPDPDALPALGQGDLQPTSGTGWYHFDTELVLAPPQGFDDGFEVGVVDVYANHQDAQWAGRYLPLGEFNTFDEALSCQQSLLQQRLAADGESAFSPAGFNVCPALYEKIAWDAADDALTDLKEQNDGHLPLDFDGGLEPEWEGLTSKEWEAYRDHLYVRAVSFPEVQPVFDNLPRAIPGLADDNLIAGSIYPDAPYLQAADFALNVEGKEVPQNARLWDLRVVEAAMLERPGHTWMGNSVVCVDFDIDEDEPGEARWLEVAQFADSECAVAFVNDFESLIADDRFADANGPRLAELIVRGHDLSGTAEWQTMDSWEMADWKVGNWMTHHNQQSWQPSASAIPISGYEQGLFTDAEVRYPLAVYQLEVVPTRTPDGSPLGHSAVFVNHPVPNGPTRSEWLEMGQFDSEERAQAFKAEFYSVVGSDLSEARAMPRDLAELVAEEMNMGVEWQLMGRAAQTQLKAGVWSLTHELSDWQPQVQQGTIEFEPERNVPDLDM